MTEKILRANYIPRSSHTFIDPKPMPKCKLAMTTSAAPGLIPIYTTNHPSKSLLEVMHKGRSELELFKASQI